MKKNLKVFVLKLMKKKSCVFGVLGRGGGGLYIYDRWGIIGGSRNYKKRHPCPCNIEQNNVSEKIIKN